MNAYKKPSDGAYYSYDFTTRLGAATITSILEASCSPGTDSSTLSGGESNISGTTVLVFWSGGTVGQNYITHVRIMDSLGHASEIDAVISVTATGLPDQDCSVPDPCCGDDDFSTIVNPTALPLFGTPPKRDIIQMAREECALAGYDFESAAEEEASALRRLQSMLAEWQENDYICLGYNFAPNGYGSVTDDSGIPRGALEAVSTYLALRLAPNMGKTLSEESKYALRQTMSRLKRRYQKLPCIPQMEMGRGTIRGAGSRRFGRALSPYFTVDVSDSETVQ